MCDLAELKMHIRSDLLAIGERSKLINRAKRRLQPTSNQLDASTADQVGTSTIVGATTLENPAETRPAGTPETTETVADAPGEADEDEIYSQQVQSRDRFRGFVNTLTAMADADSDPSPSPTNPNTFRFTRLPLAELFDFFSSFWNTYSHLSAASSLEQELEILDTLEEETSLTRAETSHPADFDGLTHSILWS
jgi:hypothetical protein